jgi:peptidoglycan/LPS O-acetylase OafA/YrhL
MGERSERHIDSLDGLRGIAILLVFFFHYLPRSSYSPLSWLASIGWSGVDLFFVLSGFLITGILYDTRESSNFFSVFYARRALRLFPLYFFAVGIVLLAAVLLHTTISWVAIPFYIYGANIMLAVKGGVPDFTPYFQCIHFWSLAVEEQFYSLWPLVMFFVRKRKTLMTICAGGVLGALVFRIVLTRLQVSTWILYCQLPSRMDALLAGAMLALVLRGPRAGAWRSPRRLYMLLGGCLVILALLFLRARSFIFSSGEMTSWGYSIFAGVYLCILALALIPGTVPNFIGRASVLRFFGRYSYGLYVWHDLPSPVCVSWQGWFLRNIHSLVLGQTVYALAMLALFTGLAVASYHLLELPFLRLKSRFRYTNPVEESPDEQGLNLHIDLVPASSEVKKQVLPPW